MRASNKYSMHNHNLPIVVGSEGGPCPSLLDAERATLTSFDDGQRSEGTSMTYSQMSSTQEVFRANVTVLAELNEKL